MQHLELELFSLTIISLKVVKSLLIPLVQFKHTEFLALSLSYISTPPKIQLSAKDFENEKIDRQSMQHQLHKVLKELRKARDQIAKLETAVSVAAHHNHMFTVFQKYDFSLF